MLFKYCGKLIKKLNQSHWMWILKVFNCPNSFYSNSRKFCYLRYSIRHLKTYAEKIVFHKIVLKMTVNIFVVLAWGDILFLKSISNKNTSRLSEFWRSHKLTLKTVLGWVKLLSDENKNKWNWYTPIFRYTLINKTHTLIKFWKISSYNKLFVFWGLKNHLS